MTAAPDFRVLGTFAHHGKDDVARLAVSLDGEKIAVVLAKDGADTATPLAGPWTTEVIRRCAENVLAGNPRALTWSPALLCLAAFVATTFLIAEQAPEPAPATEPKEP